MPPKIFIAAVLLVLTATTLPAKTVYVRPPEQRSGTATTPPDPPSIQDTLDTLEPGDTCVFLAGTYRESLRINVSGTEENPIRIVARGEVVLDGTDPIDARWSKQEKFYRAPLAGTPVEQVFDNGIPLTMARWPNATFQETWMRSTWARSAQGAKKDLMICDALEGTGIDWTGATAVLNVGHQYKTWTREVLSHAKGSREFTYQLTERLGDGKDDGRTWWDDRFYLTNTIEALDAPGEWHHDAQAGFLYLIPDGPSALQPGSIAVKRRDYGISGSGVRHIQLTGFRFHGCTIRFDEVEQITIDSCRIRFPGFTNVIWETMPDRQQRSTPCTSISGNHNVIRNVLVAYGSGIGILASGQNNRIENCIVHDVGWSGSINFSGIRLLSEPIDSAVGSTVSHCEVFNTGNIGIAYRGPANVVEWNHVHHTGLACRDIAAIHTGSPRTRGSIARYNWVHHSMGKGIRGDDQTRGLTVHHNLVWACDEGIIVKGDDNAVYHNTILGADGHGVLIIPTRQEPKKWWTRHEILPIQNRNSRFFNNYSEVIVYRHDPIPQNEEISHNVTRAQDSSLDTDLVNIIPGVANNDFDPRPRPHSPLVDAGTVVPGMSDRYSGSGPDIGAYEHDKPIWRPGPNWTAPQDIVLKIDAEVARSHSLPQAAGRKSIPLPAKLRQAGLNESALRKLQRLYDTCWTDEELKQRSMAIRRRAALDEPSPEYRVQQAIVVELHRNATRRLIERAPTVLTAAELVLLQHAMPASIK